MNKAPDVLNQRTLSLNPIRHNRRKSKTGNSILVKLPIPNCNQRQIRSVPLISSQWVGRNRCVLIEN